MELGKFREREGKIFFKMKTAREPEKHERWSASARASFLAFFF